MNKQVLIFGTGDIAQLAHYYFCGDSEYDVAAFTVDSAFMEFDQFCGLPVIAFEEATSHYAPDAYDIFIALSYSKMNEIRKQKYLSAKAMGYRFASYISSRATVLNDGEIGENCFILENNTIQPFARIGNNVTLWSGNHIGHHSIIKDHCFISSHVVVSGGVEIGEQCFIGVNATLRDHITIGKKCIIGAGTLLVKDADEEGVYIGQAATRSPMLSHQIRKI